MRQHFSCYLFMFILWSCLNPQDNPNGGARQHQERSAPNLRNHTVYERGKIVAGAIGENILAIPHTEPGDGGMHLTWMIARKKTDMIYDMSKAAFHLLALDYIGDDSLQYYPSYMLDFTDGLGKRWPGIDPFILELDPKLSPEATKRYQLPVYPLTWDQKLRVFLTSFAQDNGLGRFYDRGDTLEVVMMMDSVFYGTPVWLPQRSARWHALVDHWVLNKTNKDFKGVRYAVSSRDNSYTSYSEAYACHPELRGKVALHPLP
ncbi:hypothetical protein HB364_13910 [Pseudoflavitalea sp. X16]|uniref:hypothetical protein n=1 Tax=Paraflavitalea devenefica TaxID=2716334 RepID=UPI00142107F9|nr:hypothetical protein [Paraflavitalea devenefica]NII26184.1 hypothetical protein [Paraflavitalea devenefica]